MTGAPVDPTNPQFDYHSLSLADLVKARDLYHLHLTRRKGAIATAIGCYLIRKGDSRPGDAVRVKGTGPKTFQTAEVRSYSWPCILVFVERWVDEHEIGAHDVIPDRLFMPDGKVVPVCVVEAAPELVSKTAPAQPRVPKNFLGGGYPVIADVQGETHFGSIGCLVTDGHLVYALTNRHVAGRTGETLYAPVEGERTRIGVSSERQLGRLKFSDAYPGWNSENVFLHADVGLIEIADKTRWTPQIYSIGTMGPLADLSIDNLSFDLLKTNSEGHDVAKVRAFGAASGEMYGKIWAFFYRYSSVGGFDYVADLLIGPRSSAGDKPFSTQHGDSGTLWLLEPTQGAQGDAATYRPMAVQWGGNVLSSRGRRSQSFALATLLSTVCRMLEVDPIRDWGFALPEYWGTVGHFTIANMACEIAGKPNSNLRKLMQNNLENITFQLADITISGTKGLSGGEFVPLADVPDLVWKMSPRTPQGDVIKGSRGPRGHNPEQPNHFADMDEPPPDGGPTLLELCRDPKNIDPDVWIEHARKFPPKKGGDAAAEMGLLPFRVWQIYDAMVDFVKNGERDKFVCAAGVLAHYVGDACQPLHISFLHHGDPDHPVTRTVTHERGKKAGESEDQNLSSGVHEDYEQTMFRDAHEGGEMKSGLQDLLAKGSSNGDPVRGGRAAGIATVDLMQRTFATIHPKDICDLYDQELQNGSSKSDLLATLFSTFGEKTIEVMSFGCQHLARLWESAWAEGKGDTTIRDVGASEQSALADLYNQHDFLQSFLLTEIGAHLAGRHGAEAAPPSKPARKRRAAHA